MKRDLYQKLVDWKNSKKRKPLILKGARQVGKTWLLKEFALNEFEDHLYLDFEEDPLLKSFFESSLDPKQLISKLQTHTGQKIRAGTLMIFDEVQEAPNALNSLKYFCEKASQYPVIAAGSLLGIKLKAQKSFPVGKVNFLTLYPLSFFEFLQAMGKSSLCDLIGTIQKPLPLDEAFHLQLKELLRTYLCLGGMPEAVATFIESHDWNEVRRVHREILDAYELDFAKHAQPSDIMKISAIWQCIPGQLAKENKKFIFAAIKKSSRGREYEGALQWLVDAGLIHKSFLVSVPRLPLSGYTDHHSFKIYALDSGLLATMSGLLPKTILEGDVQFTEFKGAITENFVAQELFANTAQPPYYWTSNGKAELDFLVENDGNIYPLEVKSGVSERKKSLNVYGQTYQPKVLLRTSPLNLKQDGQLLNVPLYLVAKWKNFV